MHASSTKRKPRNINMTDGLLKMIDKFKKDNALVSRSDAVEQLIILGLDADTCGIESSIIQSKRLTKAIDNVASLVRESIRSADTASALSFYAQIERGIVSIEQFTEIYPKAKKLAIGEIAKLKKKTD